MVGKFFQKLLVLLPRNTRVVLWMVALPLMLAAVGAWEWQQYAPSGPHAATVGELAEIDRLQAMLARVENDRHATLAIDGKRYGNPLASQMVRQAIAELQGKATGLSSSPVVEVVRPFALLAVAAGLLAALWGAAGLWWVRAAGQRAVRSRDELVQAFARWHAQLPRYLGVLLALLALAFTTLLGVRACVVYEAFAVGHGSRGEIKLQVALVVFAGLLAWGALGALWRLRGSLKVLEDEPSQVLGRVLTAQDAPGLWRYVNEMAARVGAPAPDHVMLGMKNSFYVTAADTVVQPTRQLLQGQTLHLPLTYLTLLRRDEIDAIVAHEMGHFAGEDTAYSLRFAPLYAGMVQAVHSIADGDAFEWGNAPAATFGGYLIQRFDLAVKHWSRVRELAADQAGARVAGAEALARALVRISALAGAVNQRVAEIARRPDEAGHDLIELLHGTLQNQPPAPPDFAIEVATAHPHDTHPPTLERLQALGQPLRPALVEAALAPADPAGLDWVRSLFADSQAQQQALLDDFKSLSRERNAETRKALSAIAERGTGVVEFHDRRALLWVFALLGLVLLGGAGVLLMAEARSMSGPGRSSGSGAVAAGMLGAAAIFLGLVFWAWKRSQQMVMAFTREGLRLPGLAPVVPWGDIAEHRAIEAHGGIVLVFSLKAAAPAPGLAHGNYRRQSYERKKHQLVISMSGVRGMKNAAFFALLNDYRRSWYAREALAGM